jgi:hypothetical protein
MEKPPTDGPDQESLAEDIFGTAAYSAQLPSKKEFLPWHRPRKQFVRHRQWCGEVGKLIDAHKRDTLRYLGLPGVDLLDLRCFHQHVCQPRNLKLRFLGFNTGASPVSDAETDLNISLDEVRKLEFIDPTSDIIWDDFSRLGNQDSIAWKRAVQFGPYDIINLDLCDGFGAHPPGTLDDTHYNAVNNLLSLQARKKEPWMLLLTTRAGQEFVHPSVLQQFVDKYLANLASCVPFKAGSVDRFQVGTEEELNLAMKDPTGLLRVFLVGLCKWLIGLAYTQQPPSKIEVRSVIGYRVLPTAPCEDLISLAIKIEPTFMPVTDPAGLALSGTVGPDECAAAAHAVRKISGQKDADALLAASDTLRAEMVTATAELLGLARYDVGAFHTWLEQYS